MPSLTNTVPKTGSAPHFISTVGTTHDLAVASELDSVLNPFADLVQSGSAASSLDALPSTSLEPVIAHVEPVSFEPAPTEVTKGLPTGASEETMNRMRQAARILANGAIRAARRRAQEAVTTVTAESGEACKTDDAST